MPKVVFAFDSFKGCLSAHEACLAAAKGVAEPWRYECVPLSDGGEGTAAILTAALGGETKCIEAHDALMRPIHTEIGIVGTTAIVDVASVCGLFMIEPAFRNPLKLTTYGVGEVMQKAIAMGCRHLIVGLGGSATCDLGRGMLQCMGTVPNNVKVTALCDVNAPLCGPTGAVRMFAPQKGATPEMEELLEQDFQRYADHILTTRHIDLQSLPGAGAAGGLGAAMHVAYGAQLTSGAEYVIGACQLTQRAKDATLVVTGEGHSDQQTLQGKLPMQVAQCLKRMGIKTKVALISGGVSNEKILQRHFDIVRAVTPSTMQLAQAMKKDVASQLLRTGIQNLLADL